MRGARYQTRLLLDASLVAVPGLAALGIAIVAAPVPAWLAAGLVVVALLATAMLARRARNRAIYPLHTAANLLAALRAGDTSLRAAGVDVDDSAGHVMWEINALADTLRAQRLKVKEADALLAKVIATTDIALFAFDDRQRLTLANPAAGQLLGRAPEALLGASAESLGLTETDAGVPTIVSRAFPGGAGRFEIRRRRFREGGLEHELVSVSDLSRALREEERSAWQRLVRVLGHEIRNSLAPIKSIATTLADLNNREPPPADWRSDLASGLALIGQRADALTRFLVGFSLLTRLPPPERVDTPLGLLLERTARLERRLAIVIAPLPELGAYIDPDQIEQAVINLLRNAVDAALVTGGAVHLSLRASADPGTAQGARAFALIAIEDEGPGLVANENAFVPFFTTKPDGSGIGLALARQIAEAHGGSVTLENRTDRAGCVAVMSLPLADRRA